MDLLARRRYVIGGFILIVGVIFIVKLFNLQVLSTTYKQYATNNVVRKIVQYPSRGLIYDRNGELLVINKAAYDLLITPREVSVFDTTTLCNILKIKKTELEEKIRDAKEYSNYKPYIIVKQISPETYAFLQEQMYKYPGFYIQPRTLREYPRKIASHVLGYVGEVDDQALQNDKYYQVGDYTGISGIERAYENLLRGEKGVKYFLVDVHNRVKGSYNNGRSDVLSHLGKDITSTLDADLQEYAEQLLKNKKGSVVAIEPSTGEVLALVSAPNFDPNLLVGRERSSNYFKLSADTLQPMFNRALMARYPPGSTFKMVNALIALNERVISPYTQFTCAHGYHVGSFTQRCHHNQAFRLTGSIAQSCNAYYCYVFRYILEKPLFEGVRNGYDVWREKVLSFGFGKKLGTDLANEAAGFVPTSEYYEKNVFKGSRWRALPIISLAIGQGELGITPLQMANYASILANRGYYYTPHVVKNIEGQNGIGPRFLEKHTTLIDDEHFEKVLDGMERVMEPPGTGWHSKIPGIRMCGKTGSVQNPPYIAHSVFMGFAPRENPQIAISVYIENGEEGSYYAAPIASLLVEKYINGSISQRRKVLEKRMMEAELLNPFGLN